MIRDVFEKRGTVKLRSYWKNDIYVVVSSDPDLRIKPKKGSKPIRTADRNLLLKCNELPIEASNPYFKLKVSSPQKPWAIAESQTESESDSDSEFVLLEKPSKPKATLPSYSTGRK